MYSIRNVVLFVAERVRDQGLQREILRGAHEAMSPTGMLSGELDFEMYGYEVEFQAAVCSDPEHLRLCHADMASGVPEHDLNIIRAYLRCGTPFSIERQLRKHSSCEPV